MCRTFAHFLSMILRRFFLSTKMPILPLHAMRRLLCSTHSVPKFPPLRRLLRADSARQNNRLSLVCWMRFNRVSLLLCLISTLSQCATQLPMTTHSTPVHENYTPHPTFFISYRSSPIVTAHCHCHSRVTYLLTHFLSFCTVLQQEMIR